MGLVLVTLIAFLPLFGNDFVNYDDDLYITDRPEIAAGVDAAGVAWAFTTLQGANWFPLTRLSWMVDAELFGLSPRAFHATSLLLHVATSLLLFIAFRRLSGELWPSAFVAAVFAVHPLHVESVAWAACRKDVLSGFFFALCLLCHERASRGRHPVVWGAVLFASLALGLMAKPMLVTLPFVLLLLDLWPLGRLRSDGAWSRAALRRSVLEKLPIIALVVAAGVMTLVAQRAGGAVQTLEGYPFPARLANAVDSILWYGVDVLWPKGLAVFYPYPHQGLPLWRVALVAAGLAGITAWTWRERHRRPYLATGWLWFLGMLVPVLGLVQVGGAARADRYTYLPLIGLSVMLAWGIRDLATSRSRVGRLLPAVIAAVIALLVGGTFLQARTWRNSSSLFRHALQETERNSVAHINLAVALQHEDEVEEADRQLTEAISIAPNSVRAHGIRGEVRITQQRYAEAKRDLRVAVRLEPESARWLIGLGRIALEERRSRQAIAQLREALELDPAAADADALLGLAFARDHQLAAAEASYARALAGGFVLERKLGVEGSAQVRAQLAAVLMEQGKLPAALQHLEEALLLRPEDGTLHGRRGALLGRLGREAEAVESYREALRLGDRSVQVLNNLAWLLVSARDPQLRMSAEAVALAREAVEATDAGEPSVLDTLAAALDAAGRRGEAREIAQRALELAEQRGDEMLAREIRARLASQPDG